MADLVIDLPTLSTLYGELNVIAENFLDAKIVSHELSGAVGHDGLAGKVDAFSKGWDERRAKLIAAMQAISASIRAIHDTFQQVDAELAAALTQGS